jgi:hypothetical protein
VTSEEITLAALDAVEKAALPYIIVGAVALNCYTFARATKDVDFVLGVPLGGIEAIAPHLPSSFQIDPQPRMELSTGTYRWIIRVDGADFFVKIFHLANDPHHQEEFVRRRTARLESLQRSIVIPTAEDLLIQKLRWGRTKDLDDARNLWFVRQQMLDVAYVERWCRQHGTLARLEEIRRSIPEI